MIRYLSFTMLLFGCLFLNSCAEPELLSRIYTGSCLDSEAVYIYQQYNSSETSIYFYCKQIGHSSYLFVNSTFGESCGIQYIENCSSIDQIKKPLSEPYYSRVKLEEKGGYVLYYKNFGEIHYIRMIIMPSYSEKGDLINYTYKYQFFEPPKGWFY